ncbi:uncharacterized protein LACBIDRAFT_314381 [Laccaria bicolor S238N-H82]|uniref:Predicted protein n=1 Tax=Laccaria bicolor (strain S238N-H82 / ATCC MYA-4686) TaxID=486041 RepID=B0DYF3_LACBS|nr:uncharacterized protein LACBIDRAFT_314381 [Laccaria bicolor S238N-H82]EDR00426.1 predicted protein [Laccaria bicolor S238N-H82]|eukprot:XP_001888985.1 predicted protein [Laccaria bicolor S238N-H82]
MALAQWRIKAVVGIRNLRHCVQNGQGLAVTPLRREIAEKSHTYVTNESFFEKRPSSFYSHKSRRRRHTSRRLYNNSGYPWIPFASINFIFYSHSAAIKMRLRRYIGSTLSSRPLDDNSDFEDVVVHHSVNPRSSPSSVPSMPLQRS